MISLRIVGALALAAAVAGYGEWRAHSVKAATASKYELAIAKQGAQAAKLLADESAEVLRLERGLHQLTDRLRDESDARTRDSRIAGERLAAAVSAGRLRDPNAAGCGCGGGGAQGADPARATAGAGDPAEAGGLLSVQLTELLQRLTREADAVNDAYAICRADAIGLRLQLSPRP